MRFPPHIVGDRGNGRFVYHGTFGKAPDELEDGDTLQGNTHVGTREAALGRMYALAAKDGGEIPSTGRIIKYERPEAGPHTWADPSLPSDVSEARLAAGESLWWQADEDSVYDTPNRYVNEYEDPGSFSYVVNPAVLRRVGEEKVEPHHVLQGKQFFNTEGWTGKQHTFSEREGWKGPTWPVMDKMHPE